MPDVLSTLELPRESKVGIGDIRTERPCLDCTGQVLPEGRMAFADLFNSGFDRPCHIHPGAFARGGGFADPARESDGPPEFLHKKIEFCLRLGRASGIVESSGFFEFSSQILDPLFVSRPRLRIEHLAGIAKTSHGFGQVTRPLDG